MRVKKQSFKEFVASLKPNMLSFIEKHPDCTRLQLEEVVDLRRSLARLAFIRAYKALEAEGAIKVTRPSDVPFPVTDFETRFQLEVK